MKSLHHLFIGRAAVLLLLVAHPSLSPAQPLTLGQALNAPTLNWTSQSGQPAWVATTNVSHDGVASATVGPLAVGAGNANLNATVSGPTFVRFWTKANADYDRDDFLIKLDNGSLGRILQRVDDWQQDMVFVPAGAHTLTWNYYRDVFAAKGAGQAWVDEVELVPGNGAPQIYRPPASQTVWRGQGVNLFAGVAGANLTFLNLQWLSNGVPIPNARGIPFAVVANWAPESPVDFALVFSNSLGVVTSPAARITAHEPVPLATALDLPGAAWTTGTGNRPPWFGQNSVFVQGGSAAAIGPVAPSSICELTALLNGPGVLRFLWKIDAANNDVIELIANGTVDFNYRIRDAVDWQERFYFIPVGARTVGWRFTRDSNSRAAQGMAWVDGLQFTPGETKPIFTSAPTNYTTPIGTQGGGFRFLAIGTPAISAQWLSNGVPIPGATFGQFIPRDPIYPATLAQYSVQLSNRVGVTTSAPVSVTVLPPIPFDEALETTGLVWRASAPFAWYGATNATGGSGPATDYALSPTPGDGTTPMLETTITGPARLGFNWRVNFSRIDVRVNGQPQAGTFLDPSVGIFGDRSFLFLDAGNNAVEWIHLPHTNGFGSVTLDQVTVEPGTFAPQVLRIGGVRETIFEKPPTNQLVDAGTTAIVEVEALGSAPLSYHWQRSGEPIAAPSLPRLTFPSAAETDSGTYSVIVSNAVSVVTSGNAQLTVLSITSLVAAIDAPALSWRRRGSAFWTAQTTNTHDGIDAAVNGLISGNSGGFCELETSVTGPGRLTFWWKNNGDNFDSYEFLVDGETERDLDNDNTWQEAVIDLPAGAHTLTWNFEQDGAPGATPARAFLDEVRFQPGAFAPVFTKTNHPPTQTVNEGDNLTLYAEASGTPPLTYRLFRDNQLVRTVGNGFFFMQNVAPLNAGSYTIAVSNATGQVIGAPCVVQVIAALPLAEATDAPELFWSSFGATRWIGQAAVKHDGVDAASSARLFSAGLNSSLFTTVEGPGTLSFWWKLQGEATTDSFDLQIDGVLQPARLTLNQDWSQQSVTITNGLHSITWIVRAGARFGSPFDPIQGWLDQVDFTPNDPRLLSNRTTVTSGGQMQLHIAGPVGRQYRVETSTNLTAWSVLTTETLTSTRAVYLVNINPAERARFFRVVPGP